MPSKFRFKRDKIITVALEPTQKKGISTLTARCLAEKPDSSSKVIFGLFENIVDKVHWEVKAAAKKIYAQYINTELQKWRCTVACVLYNK